MKTFWCKSKNHWSKSNLKGKEQRRPTEKKRNLKETPTALPLSHGVPPGSILGPLLFNVYVNDLPTVPKACSVELYVDDSKPYLTFQSKDADLAWKPCVKISKPLLPGFAFLLFFVLGRDFHEEGFEIAICTKIRRTYFNFNKEI